MKQDFSFLGKVKFDHYAVRQWSLFFWHLIIDNYHTYSDFVKTEFSGLVLKYEANEKAFFRSIKEKEEIQKFVQKNIFDANYWTSHVEEFEKRVNNSMNSLHKANKFDFEKKSNAQLRGLLENNHNIFGLTIGGYSSTIFLIQALNDSIQKELVQKNSPENMTAFMEAISTPVGRVHYIEEEIALAQIALSKNKKSFGKLLQKHVEKYSYMLFSATGKVLIEKDFVERIKLIENPEKSVSEWQEKEKLKEKRFREILAILKPSKIQLFQINTLRKLLALRVFEEFHISFYNFVATNIFKEISKRFFISVNQLYLMTVYEISDLLDGKTLDFFELNKRKDFALIIRHKNERFVLSGENARTVFSRYFKKEKISFNGVLRGQTAFPGKAKGTVKIFFHPSHVYEFKQGQILVTAQTNPIYVPAMKKAGAIVTDEGGVTCHAAIVSRELGIPCIIGTKIATRVFRDNDLVEVDAEIGTIKLLKRAKK